MGLKFKSALVVLGILLLDQVSKILVKTTMTLGQSISVFDWFEIYFIENPGMAFGMTLGSKTLLTLLRVVLIVFIIFYLFWLIKKQAKTAYICLLSGVLAGAIGNLIDCLFFGLVFTESTPLEIAKITAFDGYGSFLQGKVVDMLYFPLFRIPDWMPIFGGQIFFSAIFNLADAAISVCVALIFIFYNKEFGATLEEFLSQIKTKFFPQKDA